MATKETDVSALKVASVTPPPMNSGRKPVVSKDQIAAVYETIHGTGNHATLVNDDGSPMLFAGEKGKQSASTMATRVKKALLNSPDTDYEDRKQLRSRTWEQEDGKFAFSVYETPSADGDGD